MNLLEVFERFPDQKSCIAHFEKVRWGDNSHWPLCGSVDVAKKAEGKKIGRWSCHDCKSSFNVLLPEGTGHFWLFHSGGN